MGGVEAFSSPVRAPRLSTGVAGAGRTPTGVRVGFQTGKPLDVSVARSPSQATWT